MSTLASARPPLPGAVRFRAKRTAETTAPTMITTAPTPLPTAARTRGKTPKTSLPTGIAVPWTVSIGAVSRTPTASPDRKISAISMRWATVGRTSR